MTPEERIERADRTIRFQTSAIERKVQELAERSQLLSEALADKVAAIAELEARFA